MEPASFASRAEVAEIALIAGRSVPARINRYTPGYVGLARFLRFVRTLAELDGQGSDLGALGGLTAIGPSPQFDSWSAVAGAAAGWEREHAVAEPQLTRDLRSTTAQLRAVAGMWQVASQRWPVANLNMGLLLLPSGML
jgi:hypothetical protein